MWEAIGGSAARDLDAADPVYRRWTRRMMRARRLTAWIAEDPARAPLGSGAVWITEAQPRPKELARGRPYILSMYTEPGARGLGVASAIVRAIVAHAKREGYPRVTLHASPMGRPVYRRLGFERSWEMRLFLDRAVARSHAARRRRVRR